MKLYRGFYLLLLLILFAACIPGGNSGDLPDPSSTTIHAPSVESAMSAYLEAWQVEDYTAMHNMLVQAARDTISQEDYTIVHQDALTALKASEFDYQILSTLTNPNTAQVAYRIIYHSGVLGDIQRDMIANFSLEDGDWLLQWDASLILPELAGGNYLVTDCRSPARGEIYDRNGLPVVTQADAVALGIVPGQILDEQEVSLLNELWQLTGLRPATIRALYAYAQPEWYIPVAEVTAQAVGERYNVLSGLGGLQMSNYTSRFYHDGGIASQAIGYTQAIFPEELDEYLRRGYCGDEKVGKQGIESWGEDYLAGNNGAALYVANQDGQITTLLASVDPYPARSFYLTIDKELQYQAQQAMGSFSGAIVVMEIDSGRILAMVSSPGFDPNLFDARNVNSMNLTNMLNSTDQPLLNRAAQGEYPPGSVFKIVTAAAALESGLYTPDSEYDCQYEFTELADRILYDWTWTHCEEEKAETGEDRCNTLPSGVLTLPEGLMRSCNPWFYHIGLDLYNQGQVTAIADMAVGFGLGQGTSIEQVAEAEGNMPYPRDGVEATSLAIGQAEMLVTPLQVVRFTAAVANGGTLYRPQVVERIVDVNGNEETTFEAEIQGNLPVSDETLLVLQDAMLSVTNSPRGTAYRRMRGLSIQVAGKTGTAETAIPDTPHSWFTGYSLANQEDKPDIAVVVLVEYSGEGSEYAAPIFRRIVEIYFYGRPQTVYWWESQIGVTRTPTLLPTETPVE